MTKKMCLALTRKWNSASDTEIVSAKNARGVWGKVPHASCQTLNQECSQTCCAKPAAQPAAGEPIPVAPVEHVQLFRVKYSHQKKWHTERVAQ